MELREAFFYLGIFSAIGCVSGMCLDFYKAPVPKKDHLAAKMKSTSKTPAIFGGFVFSILGLVAIALGEPLIGLVTILFFGGGAALLIIIDKSGKGL